MRAAPPIQVLLRDDRRWRAAVRATALLGALASVAWAFGHRAADSPTGLLLVASLLVAVTVGLARSLARRSPVALRWDGLAWHLGDDLESMTPGDLSIAIDLDRWLLLRFVETAPGTRRARAYWLPVDRRGLEPRWHALRCALYSPRPQPTAPVTADDLAEPDPR